MAFKYALFHKHVWKPEKVDFSSSHKAVSSNSEAAGLGRSQRWPAELYTAWGDQVETKCVLTAPRPAQLGVNPGDIFEAELLILASKLIKFMTKQRSQNMKSEHWILVTLQKQLDKGSYKQTNIDCILFIRTLSGKFPSDMNKKEKENWQFISEMEHSASDFSMSFLDATHLLLPKVAGR